MSDKKTTVKNSKESAGLKALRGELNSNAKMATFDCNRILAKIREVQEKELSGDEVGEEFGQLIQSLFSHIRGLMIRADAVQKAKDNLSRNAD